MIVWPVGAPAPGGRMSDTSRWGCVMVRSAVAAAVVLGLIGVASGPCAADPVVMTTIGGFNGPVAVAVSPDGGRAYVANDPGNSVSEIDTATSQKTGPDIAVGQAPYGVAVTPDGNRAYVTNFNSDSVSVIDTRTRALLGQPILVGSSPYGLAITPDGKQVYVANRNSFTVSVIDTATNQKAGPDIAVGKSPQAVAVAPDGTRAYVSNYGSDSVSVISTATHQKTGPDITVGDGPVGVAVTPDGHRAYVANYGSDSVSVIDTASSQGGGPDIMVGDRPKGIVASPDGTRVYVTNLFGNTLSVIDTATSQKTGPDIAVGTGPYAVAVTPDGSRAYVTNGNANSVSVIALRPAPPHSVTATAGDRQATAAWAAPTFSGGEPITSYTATASPGGQNCTAHESLMCTITGLTNDTSYTVTVTATNTIGTSIPSAASAPVTPWVPAPLQPPGKATGLKAKVRHGKARLTWKAVAGTEYYQVRISKAGGRTFKAWKNTTQRVYKVKVRKGKKYRFQVGPVGPGGPGPISTIRFRGK